MSKNYLNQKNIFFYSAAVIISFVYITLSYVSIPIGSDPGRLWRLSKIFLSGDIQNAFMSLEPFLPVSLYASLLGIGGLQFPLTLVQGIASALIVLLVFNYLFKNYGKVVSTFSLVLFLASFTFIDRSINLIPYPLFLLFITLGVLNFINYREQGRGLYLYLSSAFFVFSVFTFNLALTSFTIVLFYCVLKMIFTKFKNWKYESLTVAKFYAFSALLLLPWFIWRFGAAGMDFYQNPVTWLMDKYWSEFNIILWHRPKPLSSEYFDFFLNIATRNLFGPLVIVPIFILGLFRSKYSLVFLLWILSPVYPLLVGKLPTEERYIYAMMPALVILTSIGTHNILQNLIPKFKVLFTAAFLALLTFYIVNNISWYQNRNLENIEAVKEIEAIQKHLKKDEIIYTRSYYYQPLLFDNLLISASYMAEEDAVNLISWKNENEIEKIMKKYNITWVMLYNSGPLESRFNSWVSLVDESLIPKHFVEINSSNLFLEKERTSNFVLYKFKNE
jgi:hypothetical protein